MHGNDKLYNEIVGYDTATGKKIIKVEFDVKTALKRSSSPNTWAHEVVKSMFENEMANPSELEDIAKNILDDLSLENKANIQSDDSTGEIKKQVSKVRKENFGNLRKRTDSLRIRRVKKVKKSSIDSFELMIQK